MEFKLYRLKALASDMKKHGQDIDEFDFSFNQIKFRAIIDIGIIPFELLLGAIEKNWGTVIKIKKGFIVAISDYDFFTLCKILCLKAGKGSFTS